MTLKRNIIFFLFTFLPRRYFIVYLVLIFTVAIKVYKKHETRQEIISDLRLKRLLNFTLNDDALIFPIESFDIVLDKDRLSERCDSSKCFNEYVDEFLNSLPWLAKSKLRLSDTIQRYYIKNLLADVYYKA